MACSNKPGGSAKKIPRDKDAQAVVVVEAPGTQSISFADEVEPDNELAQAMVLAPGTGARGNLDGETDVDVFRVTMAEPGFIEAHLSGIEAVDLVLELSDSEGRVLARSDRGPAKIAEGIPNFAVGKGDVYLSVREFVKRKPAKKAPKSKKSKKPKESEASSAEPAGRVGPSALYELVVRTRLEPERYHEVEPNDTAEQAAEVLIGDEVQGYLGWSQDVDVWKLSVEGFGPQYSLDLDIEGVPEVAFELKILDSLDKKAKPLIAREGKKGEGLSIRNLVVVGAQDGEDADTAGEARAAEPSHYYARLAAKRSNPLDVYRVRMATRLLDVDDEVEPNDEPGSAMPLREPDGAVQKGTRRGFLTAGDVDHYQLTAGSEPLLLWVSAKPESNIDVELLVSVDGQTLGMANERKGSGEESLPDLRLPAGKTAMIVVSGQGGMAKDAGYELKWSSEPGEGAPPEEAGDDLGAPDDYEEP